MKSSKNRPLRISRKKNASVPQHLYSNTDKIIKIVGIGASSGGLEAFESFFKCMPFNSGMAFVLVTHLDSKHTSLMTEIISKYTKMGVITVTHGMKVNANTVYVLPPNKNIVLEGNTLCLIKQNEPHYTNKPINVFFRSLALARGQDAIAIVLSGAGNDGAQGLKYIKKYKGLTLVQSPATAQYDGMPQKAIQGGHVDEILDIESMPQRLSKCYDVIGKAPSILKQIFSMLRAQAGHDFSGYKSNTIYRRIEKQMRIHSCKDMVSYLALLNTNPNYVKDLCKDLLIGVTSFFRNPEAFQGLQEAIMQMLTDKDKQQSFRVWIPACSTGEEAYTIAIIIQECINKSKFQGSVQIFATDLDIDALAKARFANFSQNIESDVNKKLLKKYFVKEKNRYKISREIRKMVVFGAQNLILDPPFTMLDLISCRNLLIYLNSDLQKKIFPIFHFSLKPKGILFLGTSESIAGYVDLFQPLDKKSKIYVRKDFKSDRKSFPNYSFNINMHSDLKISPSVDLLTTEKVTLTKFISKYVLDNYLHAALVMDSSGNLLLLHGKMSYYLNIREHPDASLNVFDLIPSRLGKVFTAAMRTALISKTEVIKNNVIFEKAEDNILINLKILSLKKLLPEKKVFLLIFEKVIMPEQIEKNLKKYPSMLKMSKRIIELEEELQYSKEILQNTLEDHQSNNEELQSTNEELQSTNEEIETSKEELLSLNEELVIVNAELQTQIDRMVLINDDMNNLLNSTEIIALFLDNDLQIKRFTPRVKEISSLRMSDIGRPYFHFANNIKYANLTADIQKVIITHEAKSLEVESSSGKWYQLTIMPYVTLSDNYDGVVIIFTDVTEYNLCVKKLNDANHHLNISNQNLENILQVVQEPLLILDSNLKVLRINASFKAFFPINHNVLQQPVQEIFNKFFDSRKFLLNLKQVLKTGLAMKDFEMEVSKPIKRKIRINVNHFLNGKSQNMLILTLDFVK